MPPALRLARLYSRLELPGWGRLLASLGKDREGRWKRGSIVRVRGKWDKCDHELDLANWSERHTYFLGRYYDLDTQLVLKTILRPGDRFVDIGANIGMISLLAAQLVGPTGQVESFEPNPVPAAKFENTTRRNSVANIRLHRMALGEQPGTARLTVVSEHTGCGTLAQIPEKDAGLISATHEVPVEVGDAVLAHSTARIALIKIDVEGYECHTLRGLSATLAKDRPPVVCELVPDHLKRAGSSAEELLGLMRSHGYKGYWISSARRFLSHGLKLAPMPETIDALRASANNVLFVHPENIPDGLRRLV
jgi:FkbM family methyltransferase